MGDDTVSGSDRQRMTPTERNRRYRQRRSCCVVVVTVGVPPAVVRSLRALGMLPGDAYDPPPPVEELAAAVEKFLKAAAPLSGVAAALYSEK
jgi:hypothetical protein